MKSPIWVLIGCLLLTIAAHGQDDVDPLLDLPIEPPAPIASAIAALSTQTTVRYPPFNQPGDPPPPAQPPADDGDDPRDEPPPVFFGEEIDSENATICYVLDISGSMSHHDRLKYAKLELVRSIKALSPNFRFNFIQYECALFKFFPRLVPATDENKEKVIAHIIRLLDSGGTGTGPAVALALGDKETQAVVLLTDGEPNCGAYGPDGHRNMIRNNNTQAATINVFGVDARGDCRAFCMNVAGDSGGSYFDVTVPGAGGGKTGF